MWRDIPGFEGEYRISDDGEVLSLLSNKVLKANPSPRYLAVTLYKKGKATTCHIHRMVARVFIGIRPAGKQVCHNDGDLTNNRVGNLRYDTFTQNQRDRIAHGTSNRGESHARVAITKDIVLEARQMYADGWKPNDIARNLNVSKSAIYHAVKRLTWTYLP